MKLLTPLFTLVVISVELLMLMSLQTQVAAIRFLQIPEATDQVFMLLKLSHAMESPVLWGIMLWCYSNPGFVVRSHLQTGRAHASSLHKTLQ